MKLGRRQRVPGMGSVMIRIFLATALVLLTAVQGAVARDDCAHSDNPMMSSNGFGVASCKPYAPRYYSRAHLGEGVRGYARRASSDPMVWSDARWRSTLMGGTARSSNGRYDLRFRRVAAEPLRIVRTIEAIVIARVAAPDSATETPAKRRGPKNAYLRRNAETERLEQGSNFVGHQCRGILVITWKAGGARPQCLDNNARIRRAPE